MTLFQITLAERAGWQRRAAAELAAILDTRQGSPVIAWTVGAAGATLTGLSRLAPAEQVRASFHARRGAPMVCEHTEVSSDPGIAHLRALTGRNRVTVGLSATGFDHVGGDR